uniref:Uncharacterized protein n=1 Tax=Ascaris lumbricoides TaxID=6252 RepID=A0A0M3HY69_ASCLU
MSILDGLVASSGEATTTPHALRLHGMLKMEAKLNVQGCGDSGGGLLGSRTSRNDERRDGPGRAAVPYPTRGHCEVWSFLSWERGFEDSSLIMFLRRWATEVDGKNDGSVSREAVLGPDACIEKQCLAQCHVVLGLIIFILAALADYVSSRINTVRLVGLEECCSFYFIMTGIIGICGAASHRRGLIIAFMIMSLHAAIIFVPSIIIVSSFDIHFYQAECFGECDWHLLATSLPKNSRCQILCGENIDDNKRSTMTRLGTEYRLDAGIIAATILEMILAVVSTSLCCRDICSLCRTSSRTDEVSQLDLDLLGIVFVIPKGTANGYDTSEASRRSAVLVINRSLK